MPDITSVPGDCFARIARANGFFNYLTVYAHADNATAFPNPNQLVEGSTVKLPEKQMKAFDLAVDAEKKFKIIRKATRLEVRLCQADVSKTPAIAKATLEIAGKKVAGAAATLAIEDIDPTAVTATLTLVLAKPAAHAKAPPTTAAVANQYPPAIVAADFDDPETVWPKNGDTISWQLQVGHLEPATETRGVLQRLVNLGSVCPVTPAEDEATQRAVRCYRRHAEGLAPPADTAAVADIRAHIEARHDTP
ncbi:hypothetical protein IP87_12710 [beta proteobacterium AAP121]|nr:hypothetical protein IP80_15245 [beta proteobacterium AAP65]KPF97078.1 hypothetical protein IP87_12710 [beta proteobacterium AAP121]